jgi:hypothetical protein
MYFRNFIQAGSIVMIIRSYRIYIKAAITLRAAIS